jgi:2-amino-4-hydroxy-6-hydroxymethyldihydropteridine diphosphokinase
VDAERRPKEVRDAYVALGSNLGDRRAHLAAAVAALERTPGIEVVAMSALYETEPVGPPQGRYLNAVVRLRTGLAPDALLERLLEIESAEGRRRGPERNAPRSLDLDLLLYADLERRGPALELPHPRLAERAFVLEPLCDLAPDLVHPALGASVAELARRVRDPSAVRRLDEAL